LAEVPRRSGVNDHAAVRYRLPVIDRGRGAAVRVAWFVMADLERGISPAPRSLLRNFALARRVAQGLHRAQIAKSPAMKAGLSA